MCLPADLGYSQQLVEQKCHSDLSSLSSVQCTSKPDIVKCKVNQGALTAVSGVGSSPALVTCETSQVLLAGVSGGFSVGILLFSPHLLIGPSHMS